MSNWLAEVHASLAEIEVESGPARAAALLAGESLIPACDICIGHRTATRPRI